MEYKARIEVATPPGSPKKDKGDLLERLAEDLLRTQNYIVTNQVRITATELDLLCEHKVNKKPVYVECKAHREPISSNVFKNILGTIDFKDYQEGWLISTGPLGKDAKGFQHEWENKPNQESQRLSIYNPERVIETLISSGMVKHLPYDSAVKTVGNEDLIGDPTLLITEYGVFWTIVCLEGGVPTGVLVYSTRTGDLITEHELLRNLAQTDTSQNKLDFECVHNLSNLNSESNLNTVVEVEHGENWVDYRPARPQDFVGREEAQNQIIRYLEEVRSEKSNTRVFAIKGDSGMGKSSLIAKLRDHVRNRHYRKKIFIYAVDVRAATGPSYILCSVLACLRKAIELGFGNGRPEDLRITNPSNPFESTSIQEYLTQLQQEDQVICLVFDQFEELYSKPEAFAIFEAAQKLLLSAVAAQSSLILGFAWKTDTTVHQDHPAYHLWHRLADHRMEVEIRQFTRSEVLKAIRIFQRQFGEELRSDLRTQLTENNQGYPWLLKKLCIHVYETVKSGISQSELVNRDLDVESLFDRDLKQLTAAENTCLKLIAESAPVDWYKILEVSDKEVLGALQHKRLIIRSGDRLNLYWDIFREYVLTQTVPSIPFNYLPSSPSISALLKVVKQLDSEERQNYARLGDLCGFVEKTIENVIRDLKMFDIATVDQSEVKLASSIEISDEEEIMQRLRHGLRNHALTLRLSKRDPGEVITSENIIQFLKQINPTASHKEITWKLYAEKMVHWLSVTGYLVQKGNDWIFEDQGKVNLEYIAKTRKGRKFGGTTIFIGDTSPAKTIECLDYLKNNQPLSSQEIEEKGFRNALAALRGLGVVKHELGRYFVLESTKLESKSSIEIVWEAACNEKTIKSVVAFLKENPTVDRKAIGKYVDSTFKRNWSEGSVLRIGNALRQWGVWILTGSQQKQIPKPPGRIKTSSERQMKLFKGECH